MTTEHLITNQALVDEVARECGEEVLSDSGDDETDIEVISANELLKSVKKDSGDDETDIEVISANELLKSVKKFFSRSNSFFL
ncbi:hypothetical protein QE152_g15655 [Popillia japonica]|uniref:Uncharacterized protein n=1 Tax=Popillia japonica TaxID=7064 RepID=A0AAW1L6Z7_POPJA